MIKLSEGRQISKQFPRVTVLPFHTIESQCYSNAITDSENNREKKIACLIGSHYSTIQLS